MPVAAGRRIRVVQLFLKTRVKCATIISRLFNHHIANAFRYGLHIKLSDITVSELKFFSNFLKYFKVSQNFRFFFLTGLETRTVCCNNLVLLFILNSPLRVEAFF